MSKPSSVSDAARLTGVPEEEAKRSVAIYDQPFLYIPEACQELGLSDTVFRELLAFDTAAGRPAPTSEFPNAYKEAPGRTARIRIPMADVQAYKVRRVRSGGASRTQ